jgi:hypothetical protein
MKFELKYKKYKQKNLKKQYGGNSFLIKDENLEYYHKKYSEFNSSITIYGEKHELEYNDFLSKYIDSLYSTDRRQIIILEKNKSELMPENPFFKFIMQEHSEKDKNIIRKQMGINLAPSPILYFSAVYKHSGNFPNTEIICGDIRLKKIFNLIFELDEFSKLNPENIISVDFLTRFKDGWQEQLSFLTAPEYLVIKDEVNALLLEILPTMKNNEVEKISNILNRKWVYLSNISMLQYIIEHMKEDVDITFFVGDLHMPHLIEEIEKLYPSLIDDPSIMDEPVFNELSNNYIQSPELSNQDDNFDTDSKYSTYWFAGKKRLTGYEIKPDIYYWIRFKNDTTSFVNYKLKGYEGEKIILEQADWMNDQKIIKLDIDNIYAYIL